MTLVRLKLQFSINSYNLSDKIFKYYFQWEETTTFSRNTRRLLPRLLSLLTWLTSSIMLPEDKDDAILSAEDSSNIPKRAFQHIQSIPNLLVVRHRWYSLLESVFISNNTRDSSTSCYNPRGLSSLLEWNLLHVETWRIVLRRHVRVF